MFSLGLPIFMLALPGLIHAIIITNDTTVAANKTFDYVIVGGGLTGITVGHKLGDKGFSVLIIEAGPDARGKSVVYNAEERINLNGFCNWQYPAYSEDGELLPWKIDNGACVGGSTSINGMVWYRPTETEIDKLETLGNPGWNWESLEPYMDAIEHNHPPDTMQISDGAGYDPTRHGYSGVINTSFPTPMRIPGAIELYKKALPQVFPGFTVGNDLSSRTSTVSASSSWTLWYDKDSGQNRRSSAAFALLYAQDQQRQSLTVLSDHKVDKVIFGENSTTAIGIEFATNVTGLIASGYRVFARKEVILAAGSLASATVLERSGIGRKSVLERVGVEILVDLPGVGSNLNDQAGTGSSALVAEEYWNDTSIIDDRGAIFAPEISLVNVDAIWGVDAADFLNDLTSPDSLRSRAETLLTYGGTTTIQGAEAVLNTTIDLIVNSCFPVAEFVGESYPTVLTTIFWPLMPLSRGHVHIASADVFTYPIITPRLFTDVFDQKIGIAIARRSRELFSSQPFAGVVADAYYDPPIGPNGTDEEYLAWYRDTSFGVSHWIGSTAMIPRELGGVVDSSLKVYGTESLRVVDAGILPFPITSHPMVLLYAVAQKAADLILAES